MYAYWQYRLSEQGKQIITYSKIVMEHLTSDGREALVTYLRNDSDIEIQQIATYSGFHAFIQYYSLYLHSALLP